MAKNFPYFKFVASEWLTGNIVFEPLSVQGLFINICALYWQRDGVLSLDEIKKRYKEPKELTELTDRFFSVSDGFISVSFLDEQLIQADHISKTNAKNGSLGGRPKAVAKRSQAKKSKEEEEQEVNKNKNNIPTLEEFLNFCKTIPEINFNSLEFSLKAKYEAWVENGWKDGNREPIKHWKTKIKNTIPYLKQMQVSPNAEKTTLKPLIGL